MKSEFGNQVLRTISTTVQEFIAEQEERRQQNPTTEDVHQKKDANHEQSINECDIDLDDLLGTVSMVIDERLVALVGHIFQVDSQVLVNLIT